MSLLAFVLTELTAELALFAAAGFLLFAIDDLAVDMERRHGFKDYGRNAFALFAEGGLSLSTSTIPTGSSMGRRR